ncbi:MAG: hypothetical protein AAF404_05885 [Pseudomonadota bacterium]
MISRIAGTVVLLAVLSACGGATSTNAPEDASDSGNNNGTEGDSGSGDNGNQEAENQLETEVTVPDSPPFAGTIFLDPDIVNESDPSAFQSIAAMGTAERMMFDRREGWVTTTPFLFQAGYDDGLTIDIQVNPEFTEAEATTTAELYVQMFGQLPTLPRKDVQTSWIHKGVNPWGGGNNNLLVHTGQGELYIADGIAEETLIHEASHTSLDADYAGAPGWIAAQQADPTFISTYAQEFPDREDIAESFLPYVALRYRRERISDALAAMFEVTMPNRI